MVAPARVFGMDVIAWSEHLTDERAAEFGVSAVSKEAAARGRSDVPIDPPRPFRSHRGPVRRGRARADEAAPRSADQHLARADRRRAGARSRRCGRGTIAAAGLDVYDQRAATLPTTSCCRSRTPCCSRTSATSASRRYAIVYADVVADIAAFRAERPPIRLLTSAEGTRGRTDRSASRPSAMRRARLLGGGPRGRALRAQRRRPSDPRGSAHELRAALGGPVPDEPGDPLEAMQTLVDVALAYMQHGDHPATSPGCPGHRRMPACSANGSGPASTRSRRRGREHRARPPSSSSRSTGCASCWAFRRGPKAC